MKIILLTYRHPELDSGSVESNLLKRIRSKSKYSYSQMLNQVQHD